MLQGHLTRSLLAGLAKQGGVHARLFSIYIFAVVRKRVGSKLRKAPESWAWMAPPPLPCTAPHTTGRAFVYCSHKRIFFKGWTGQYLRCCLCCDVQHCTTKEGNSPSHVLLLSALLSWPGCAVGPALPSLNCPGKQTTATAGDEKITTFQKLSCCTEKTHPQKVDIALPLSALHLAGNNKWLYKTFCIQRTNSEILACFKISKPWKPFPSKQRIPSKAEPPAIHLRALWRARTESKINAGLFQFHLKIGNIKQMPQPLP